MLIWVLAVLLFVIFGALGYAKGAIRMSVPLVGLVVGALLALPLGPYLRPLVPMVGLTNPLWSMFLPPVVVFFLIALIFIGLGFLVHSKVNLYYKYRADDFERLAWERLNQRLGVCLGLVAGAVYTLILGVVIYVFGYLTLQVSAGDSEPGALGYLNKARRDLQSSGLETMVAALDPAPEKFYRASDILGLLYHNPLLHSRLAAYPPVLMLAERPEFQDVINDSEYQNMLQTQASLGQILNHPKTQVILGSQEIRDQLNQLNLKDLLDYLKTGVSEIYQGEPILGRWELDPNTTMQQEKKRRATMTSADMRILRYKVEFTKGFTLMIAPDNVARLKGPDLAQVASKINDLFKATAEGPARRAVAVVPATTPAQVPGEATGPTPSMPQSVADRYGIRRGGGAPRGSMTPQQSQTPAPGVMPGAAAAPAAPPPTMAAVAAEIAKLPTVVLAEGNWKEDGGKVIINLQSGNDLPLFVGTKKSSRLEAVLRDERLYLTEQSQTMVMAKF
jgi:hypothetical protein